MRNLKFRLAHAENIMCFGPEGVDFHFADYGQVIQVKGINLDNPGTNEDPASNGAGKSSIQEILSIGLYGKTVKSPTKLKGREILNTLATKGHVEIQWDDYRVVRTFKKTPTGMTMKIQAWHSPDHIWDTEITKGGRPGITQDWIDEKLGLNHNAFCNVVIFDDSSFYSFLESDAATKREFVENLLGLDQYRKYNDNAKTLLKNSKKAVDLLGSEYNLLCQTSEMCDRRIQTLEQQQTQWKTSKGQALKDVMTRFKTKQTLLQSTDTGEQLANWQKGQDRIVELTAKIEDKESKIKNVKDILIEARESAESARDRKNALTSVVQQHTSVINSAQIELEKQLKQIDKLDKLEDGAECPVCLSVIKKDSYGKVLKHSHGIVEEQRASIRNENAAITQHSADLQKQAKDVSDSQKRIGEAEGKIAILEGEIREYRKEIAKLAAISKPDGNSAEQVLEAEISELRKQCLLLKEEYDGNSPYAEIIIQAQVEKTENKIQSDKKAAEIKVAEDQLPYYQFWVEAFGDRGIRRYVVDGIIPALNARIAYWLSYLIDSKIELTFDNELSETITRSGNSAFYYSMSNGERRRINLAVSQAFAYVMMLNSGCCPSLVFLDEITGGGIDKAGIVGIYKMIFELAKERQVFVTTHNENLMSMLQGCETVTLKKQNDVTVISS
jgi:DNA repair exonuclease SbcCD ATPase subunit